ncbi:enoyl-CoA hydratase/isomerase family protein [Thalassovita taeanensis]|uniref:2-(1,2-epoxy-1,2-dihydrophenyl)acetyl-CoA isomerase n=1 Tax=Thalassovita taeanensis TaxID=657014 RepID=A0A1H9BWR9_9RHOB|nr:enoyl-CoA hydratase-related protein [Thalassovita taeanensis]SEP93344.1 2-(1,2-epoxy-1,2-dihydrophenyl)acetyl-CoA isomerase [Thalassovita taeanensis]
MYFPTENNRVLSELVDGVLSITFNRPDFRNAFEAGMSAEIAGLMRKAQDDTAVRCIVFSGAGAHFTAGGDIAGFKSNLALPHDDRSALFRDLLTGTANRVQAIMAFDRPIIAKVRGGVAGAGLMLPLAADLVISDDTAMFVFAHQRVGLPPDGGVSYLLPRVVGWRAARRLVLTASVVKADEAQTLGIVDQIVASTDLDSTVAKAATRFTKAPQAAMRRAKQMMDQSLSNSLAAQLDMETDAIAACVANDDFDEGVTAFIEKRETAFPSAQ